MTFADRIAVLNKCSVEQVVKPHELYEKPQTRFVAELLGAQAMNLIKNGQAFVQGQNLELHIGRGKALKFAENRRKEAGLTV